MYTHKELELGLVLKLGSEHLDSWIMKAKTGSCLNVIVHSKKIYQSSRKQTFFLELKKINAKIPNYII